MHWLWELLKSFLAQKPLASESATVTSIRKRCEVEPETFLELLRKYRPGKLFYSGHLAWDASATNYCFESKEGYISTFISECMWSGTVLQNSGSKLIDQKTSEIFEYLCRNCDGRDRGIPLYGYRTITNPADLLEKYK